MVIISSKGLLIFKGIFLINSIISIPKCWKTTQLSKKTIKPIAIQTEACCRLTQIVPIIRYSIERDKNPGVSTHSKKYKFCAA